MANPDHLAILDQGVKIWNKWREENSSVEPDLSEADLKERVLYVKDEGVGINLQGADLQSTNLENANLENANLKNAKLLSANLRNTDLFVANLENANLLAINLESANLLASNLKNANLKNANLFVADLKNANLENANLKNANFLAADLENANLKNANLHYARLESVYLENANLENANLENAHLENANLRNARLENAHLENANLRNARLENVNLRNARLENANLRNAHLENAHLENAHLENAHLENAHLENANFRNTHLENAHLRDVKGLRFNSTMIRNIRLSRNSDYWTTLKQKYTGARLLFNVLAFAAFIIPYTLNIGLWRGVNTTQELFQNYIIVGDIVTEDIVNKGPCLQDKCRDLAIWQLLLGWYRKSAWLYVSLSLLLFFYNMLHFFLTRRVNSLRDAEELAGQQTPNLGPSLWKVILGFSGSWSWEGLKKGREELSQSYLWLWPLHKITKSLFWLATISLLVHLFTWLFLEHVSVPV